MGAQKPREDSISRVGSSSVKFKCCQETEQDEAWKCLISGFCFSRDEGGRQTREGQGMRHEEWMHGRWQFLRKTFAC